MPPLPGGRTPTKAGGSRGCRPWPPPADVCGAASRAHAGSDGGRSTGLLKVCGGGGVSSIGGKDVVGSASQNQAWTSSLVAPPLRATCCLEASSSAQCAWYVSMGGGAGVLEPSASGSGGGRRSWVPADCCPSHPAPWRVGVAPMPARTHPATSWDGRGGRAGSKRLGACVS